MCARSTTTSPCARAPAHVRCRLPRRPLGTSVRPCDARRSASRHRGSGAVCASSRDDSELDPIEKFVSMIFGKKALEDRNPAGMKRLSEDDAPEMYPATTTEFADPVESDDSTMAVLRPMLARTQLERRPLRLAFDSEEHGWSAREFHARVDTFGAGIVLAETQGGAVCGGYNPRGWVGLGEDRDAIAAFLFTWPDGDTSKPAIKLPKVGGPSMAVVDKPDSGPQFGAEGLTIPLTPGKERVARSRLGTFYSRIDASKKRDLFAPDEDWKGTTLTRLRVYVGAGKGEEWELDGIVWKSKVDE